MFKIRKGPERDSAPALKRPSQPPDIRVIDASAGPPVQPRHDRAIHRLRVEQEGLVDGALYDKYSFSELVTPLGVRVARAEITSIVEQSHRDEKDDEEVADELVRSAKSRVALTEAQLGGAERRLDEAQEAEAREEQILLGNDAAHRAWGAPERINENRWTTLGWVAGIPAIGMLIEIPWSYFALQVLGESSWATFAMAVVFGWAGVLLAHVAGIMLRRARAGESGRATAVACVTCLAVLALFLADIRYAFLATPVTTTTGTSLPSGLHQFHLASALVFAGWLAVNVGLWLAVAALAFLHHNGHVGAYQRAHQATDAARRELVAAKANVPDAKEALANAIARRASCPGKWDDYRRDLAAFRDELEARYLRAIATAKTDPEFTTAVEHNVSPMHAPIPRPTPNGRAGVDPSHWTNPN